MKLNSPCDLAAEIVEFYLKIGYNPL